MSNSFSTMTSTPSKSTFNLKKLIHLAYYKYALHLGLYVLTPGEVLAFNLLVASIGFIVLRYLTLFSIQLMEYLNA